MPPMSTAGSSWFARARRWWSQATGGERALLVDAALEWILNQSSDRGLAPTIGGTACPGLTAATIPTLWSLGSHDVALVWFRRLLKLQRADGSLPDAVLTEPSPFNTAQAARAFEVLEESGHAAAATARRRACQYLAAQIADDGTIRAARSGGSFERWAPPTVRLVGLAGVIDVAEGTKRDSLRTAARRAVDVVLRTTDVVCQAASLQVQLYGIEGLLDLEPIEPRAGAAARGFLRRAATQQRRDGSVPADVERRWTSSAALAHLATLWFRVGMNDSADCATACLANRQRPDGAWNGSWGRGAAYFPFSPSAWTVKFALDASLAQAQGLHRGNSAAPALRSAA